MNGSIIIIRFVLSNRLLIECRLLTGAWNLNRKFCFLKMLNQYTCWRAIKYDENQLISSANRRQYQYQISSKALSWWESAESWKIYRTNRLSMFPSFESYNNYFFFRHMFYASTFDFTCAYFEYLRLFKLFLENLLKTSKKDTSCTLHRLWTISHMKRIR